MATSGTISGNATSGLSLSFEWSRTAISTPNNQSTIRWSLKFNSTSSLNFSADKPYTLSVNGKTYSGTFTDNIDWGSGSNSTVITTGTTVIDHDSDGTKTFDVSATFNIGVTMSGTFISTIGLSGKGTLDPIFKATQPTIPSGTVKTGSSLVITLPSQSSTYTHKLTYKFVNSTGTLTSSVQGSYTWVIPRTLASQIPNSLNGLCTITCETFKGSISIGKTNLTFTLQVSDSDVPSISGHNVSDSDAGISSKFKTLIQGQSKLSVSITASGINGSTIKKYETLIGDTRYLGSSFTTDVMRESGSIEVKTTVTDSRGRTATATKSVTVTPYTPPTIESFRVARVDTFGNEDETSLRTKAYFKFNITPLSDLNTNTYSIDYITNGDTNRVQNYTQGSGYSVDSSYSSSSLYLTKGWHYDFTLTVQDYFYSVTKTVRVVTASTAIDIYKSGNGVAIGTVATKDNTLEIAYNTTFGRGFNFTCQTSSEIDLNKITTGGYYGNIWGSQTRTNAPIDIDQTNQGWLEVQVMNSPLNMIDSVSPIYQKLSLIDGRTFVRIGTCQSYFTLVWSDWCGTFTSGIWTYDKTLQGEIKAWGTLTLPSVDFNTKVMDSWYRPATSTLLSYSDLMFKNIPKMTFSTSLGDTSGSVLTYTAGESTTGAGLWFQKLGSGTASMKLDIQLYGHWK